MYKKIKNSSFMNLIWFIVATLPIWVVLIVSITFWNKETINYENKKEYENYIFNNYQKNSSLGIDLNNKYIFEITQASSDINISFDIPKGKYKFYYTFTKANGYDIQNDLLEITTKHQELPTYNINETYSYVTIEYENDTRETLDILLSETDMEMYLLILKNDSDFTQEQILNFDQLKNISIYENIIQAYLTNINETIKSNGFISNAFLNLATLFGVNNVYYSLACYYIEYLLVIILLHLAFDVLYILPNVCHKFMEKLGGERD